MADIFRRIDDVFCRIRKMDKVGDDVWAAWNIAASSRYTNCPPPEITWALLGLLHRLSRQQWAHQVVEEHLGGKHVFEAKSDAKDKAIPGVPEWTYTSRFQESSYRSCQPLSLHNCTTGENIFVNDWHPLPNTVRFDEFLDHVKSVAPRIPGESRLPELFPQGKGLRAALEYLNPLYLWDFEGVGQIELRRRGLKKYMALAEKFITAWQDPNRRTALAVLAGDWDFAKSKWLSELAPSIDDKADMARHAWLDIVRGAWSRNHDDDTLRTLVDAGVTDSSYYLKAAFDDPQLVGTAVDIVMKERSQVRG